VSPAKTAEPIEVPFALKTRVGPDAMGRDNFEGEGASHCKVLGHSAVVCAKMAEMIVMGLGVGWVQGTMY